ncbi:MAG: hypothetical protein EOP90_05305 [Lysobacteraceae bacterium]|nr:MAG: hypothetical protein EOP90_05305 [Xanthomonadaceae bacterium]
MHPLATSRRGRSAPRGARLAFALFALVSCAAAHAFDWEVDVTPAGELFPALELSQAPAETKRAIGGGNGLVGIRLRGNDLPSRLRLEVDTPGLARPAVLEFERAPGEDATTLDLHPRLEWDVAQLRRLERVRSQALRIVLEVAGKRDARTLSVRLHPLNDAPYFVREGRERVDLGWVFAGYVDPGDRVVDEVLALARAIEPQFDVRAGTSDPEATLRRIGAVWRALERRGLRYDDGDPALSRGPIVWSQRVRLPDEVWRDRNANCIDSSVLIASALERIGLRALIVLVPGHAFVGYRTGTDGRAAEYFETTLLGARTRAGDMATTNFAAARAAGRQRWRRAAARLDGRHGPDYALIDIGAARAYGIIPIGAAERAMRHPPEAAPAPAGSSREHGLP